MKSNVQNRLQLRTPVKIPPSTIEMTHKNSIFCVGSCFATHIFEKLHHHWFTTKLNPAGITYNPMSIASQIQWLLEEKQNISEPILINDRWIPFDFHGSFREEDRDATMQKCQKSIDEFRLFFKQSTIDIYTFGTAFVYEYNHRIVNNCHKVPTQYFETERLLNVSEIVDRWTDILERTFIKYPQKQVILTLSPVRHTRNGLIGNSVSKSILRTAIHELTQLSNVHYFPSYEILLDELRDYRFYNDDMIHPSSFTLRYIWDCFVQTYMLDSTKDLLQDIQKVEKMKSHRFIRATEQEIVEFNEKVQKKELEIQKRLNS